MFSHCVVEASLSRVVRPVRLALLVLVSLLAAGMVQGDEIELSSGVKYRGKLIEKSDQYVVFRAFVGSGSAEMKFPAGQVRGVTINAATAVPPAPTAPSVRPPAVSSPAATAPTAVVKPPEPGAKPADPPPAGATATRQQVEDQIAKDGASPPAWWDSVQPNHPQTLDLTWAHPRGANDPNKYLDQYLWSVAQPNFGRWKETVKMLHQALSVNKDNPQALAQTTYTLGKFYYDLDDFARAAFWFRKVNSTDAVRLARCYYKLGNKQMAEEALTRSGRVDAAAVTLYSEMGNLAKALTAAENLAKAEPDTGYLLAGNACRASGQYDQALSFYDKVQALGQGSRQLAKRKEQAAENAAMVRLIKDIDLKKIPDGSYTSSGMGFRGQVTVEVTVKAGRIESAKVTDHRDDGYFYSIAHKRILPTLVDRQGFAGVDTVTGATFSSHAIITAAGKALGEGMKKGG